MGWRPIACRQRSAAQTPSGRGPPARRPLRSAPGARRPVRRRAHRARARQPAAAGQCHRYRDERHPHRPQRRRDRCANGPLPRTAQARTTPARPLRTLRRAGRARPRRGGPARGADTGTATRARTRVAEAETRARRGCPRATTARPDRRADTASRRAPLPTPRGASTRAGPDPRDPPTPPSPARDAGKTADRSRGQDRDWTGCRQVGGSASPDGCQLRRQHLCKLPGLPLPRSLWGRVRELDSVSGVAHADCSDSSLDRGDQGGRWWVYRTESVLARDGSARVERRDLLAEGVVLPGAG